MKIHELLSDSSKWVQNKIALTSDGRNVSLDDPEAVCWCLIGAFLKCYPEEPNIENPVCSKIRKKLFEGKPFGIIAHWNDNKDTTYEQVYNLVKELDV